MPLGDFMKLLIAIAILFSYSSFAQANSQELIQNLRSQYEVKAAKLRFENRHLYSEKNYDASKRKREQLKNDLCQKELMKNKAYYQARLSVIERLKSLEKGRNPASLTTDALQLNRALKHYGCVKVGKN